MQVSGSEISARGGNGTPRTGICDISYEGQKYISKKITEFTQILAITNKTLKFKLTWK